MSSKRSATTVDSENGRSSSSQQSKRMAVAGDGAPSATATTALERPSGQAQPPAPEVIIIEDDEREAQAATGPSAAAGRAPASSTVASAQPPSSDTVAKPAPAACNCYEQQRQLLTEFQCQVCHDVVYKAHTLNCSHLFCEYCIKRWLSSKITCPVCRTYARDAHPIPSIDAVVSRVFAAAAESERAERAKNSAERQQAMHSIKQSTPLLELGQHHHHAPSHPYTQFNHLVTHIRSAAYRSGDRAAAAGHHHHHHQPPPPIPFLPQHAIRVSPFIQHGPQATAVAMVNHLQVAMPSMADHSHHHHFNPHH